MSLCAALCFAISGATAHALPVASGGYSLSTIDAGANAFGDVVTVGDYVFVGVGSFGSTEIVRIAPGGATTTVATGFSALAGFAYDAVNDRLIVGDNFNDGVTGDTIYALSNPVGHAGAPAQAASLELLPFGSIPGIADVAMDLSDPTGMSILITDATEAFPPLFGGLYSLDTNTSTLSSVFDVGAGWFAGGVATTSSDVFVGDSIFGVGGRVHTADLPLGAPPIVEFLISDPALLPGQFDLEFDVDGTLLSSSVDQLLRIDPSNGDLSTIASGFDFASGLAAADDGSIFVIDGISLYKLTPVPEPGSSLLLAAGLALFAARSRRTRARH